MPHHAGLISDLLVPLRRLTDALSIRERMPQVEVAIGDRRGRGAIRALVFRVLEPPTPADLASLRGFAAQHGVEVWLQPKGPETAGCSAIRRRRRRSLHAARIRPADPVPAHRVHPGQSRDQPAAARAGGAAAGSAPGRAGRRPVLRPRQLQPAARAPGATSSASRGARRWSRGRAQNAARNGLAGRTRFEVANLFATTPACRGARPLDKVLIDPPRDGALALVKVLPPRRRARAARGSSTYLQPRHAGARRRPAGQRPRLRAARPRASSTCSRTPRTSNRSRCSSATAVTTSP